MRDEWQIKTLSEVCSFENGDRGTNYPSRSVQTDHGIPFINAGNLTDGGIDLESLRFIPRTRFTLLSNGKIRRGDILFCLRGSLGKFAGVGSLPEGAIASSLVIVRPRESVLVGYVMAYFQSDLCADMIDRYKNGAAQPNLSARSLGRFEIPVPSLSEQRRIVDILDEAFDSVATAAANVEKNLQSARALFDSHLQAVFAQRGDGWVQRKFGELIESNVIGLMKSSREQGNDRAWPYVKMNNITPDHLFDFSSYVTVDATEEEVDKFQLRNGDFLFNTRNSFELVGKSCIYQANPKVLALYNNNIMRIRFVDGVDARFVLLAFSSKPVAGALDALKSGTTNVSAIYFKDLRSLAVPVAPLPVQHKVARELEGLRAETQRLESICQRKLNALDELKKSLLHQAFTGQLTEGAA